MTDCIDRAFRFAEITEVSAPMAVTIIREKIVKATRSSIIENPRSALTICLYILLSFNMYISLNSESPLLRTKYYGDSTVI